MANRELIQIVRSCVRAFHDGADKLELLLSRDARDDNGQRALSEREKIHAEMLQSLLKEGGDQISSCFENAQGELGQDARVLQKGDITAKLALYDIISQVQEEIADRVDGVPKLSEPRAGIDLLQGLYRLATTKQIEAENVIVQLKQRVQLQDNASSSPGHATKPPNHGYRNESVSSSVGHSPLTIAVQQFESSQDHLMADRAADGMSVAVTEDDRYTMARERLYEPEQSQTPMQRYLSRLNPSSAASMHAALAPEAIQRQAKPAVRIEEAGPYFDPTERNQVVEDRHIPFPGSRLHEQAPAGPSRARSSFPESSHRTRTDSMPWTQRMLSPVSMRSGSSSTGISEPDSAISMRADSTRPYCSGALLASESFVRGFGRDYLPTLPGSNRREWCWKCHDCDFNFADPEGELLEGIYFEEGVRFRFKFLAKSHVKYEHPENAIRPSYRYGCQICSAEGRRSSTYSSAATLMAHIHANHRTILTPDIVTRTCGILGRTAGREEQWDFNLADLGSQGGRLRRFMVTSLTGLRST